jgi:hypothetical protein
MLPCLQMTLMTIVVIIIMIVATFGMSFAESWTMAAKEGLVIYFRGPPVFLAPFPDLPLRMLDYVLHVLGALSLLVFDPGMPL